MKQSIMLNSIFLVCASVFGFVNAGDTEMVHINTASVISPEAREAAKVKQDGANFAAAREQYMKNDVAVTKRINDLNAQIKAAQDAKNEELAKQLESKRTQALTEKISLDKEHNTSVEGLTRLPKAPTTSTRGIFQRIKDLILQFFDSSSLHDVVNQNNVASFNEYVQKDVDRANQKAFVQGLKYLSVADRAEVLNIVFEKEWASVSEQYRSPNAQFQARNDLLQKILSNYNKLATAGDKVQLVSGKFVPASNA